jgi:hypothetical protein
VCYVGFLVGYIGQPSPNQTQSTDHLHNLQIIMYICEKSGLAGQAFDVDSEHGTVTDWVDKGEALHAEQSR